MLLPRVRTLAMEAVTRTRQNSRVGVCTSVQCSAVHFSALPSLHLLIPTPRPRPSHGLGTDTLNLISTNLAGTSGEGSGKAEKDKGIGKEKLAISKWRCRTRRVRYKRG